MPLSVVTRSGKPMRRCGIVFGKDPITVDDGVLKQKFASPAIPRNLTHPKCKTIGDILKADQGLLCLQGSVTSVSEAPIVSEGMKPTHKVVPIDDKTDKPKPDADTKGK